MVNFLIYVVIVFAIIALVRLARVYQLSRELKGEREEDISAKDNKMNASLFIVFMLSLYGFYFWLISKYSDTLLPIGASKHGYVSPEEASSLLERMLTIDFLMDANLIVVNIVFFAVNTLLFVFAFRYIRERREKAEFYAHNNKLELFWTIIPSIFLAFIIIFGLSVWNNITDQDKVIVDETGTEIEPLIVELYGRQFDWHVRYSGEDGVLGDANVRFVDGANATGVDSLDENGWDDKVIKGEIRIPVDRPIKIQIRSQDVIHSVYLPHFRSQMNAVPGMKTYMNFIPTITTAEMRENEQMIRKYDNLNKLREKNGMEPVQFDYVLLCNKICGNSHYKMKMKVVVETEEDFNSWLEEKKPLAEVLGLNIENNKSQYAENND